MSQDVVPQRYMDDATFVKLAREVAMGMNDISSILEKTNIDQNTWETISKHPRFRAILEQEVLAWESATNTNERVRVKSAAIVEEWLPELFTRMHDPAENLNAKIEAGKLVARLAGMGVSNAQVTEGGERFSVTINLGADNQLKFEKELPPKVIDGEVL